MHHWGDNQDPLTENGRNPTQTGPANPARFPFPSGLSANYELIFKAPVVYELKKTHDVQFTFINGPTPAPAAFGIAGQYEGPFFRFFKSEASTPYQLVSKLGGTMISETVTSPEDYIRTNVRQRGLMNLDPTDACDYVQNLVETHTSGPFDGILGFSEGAAAIAGWLFRHLAEGTRLPVKFAVFMSGTPPAHYQKKDVLLADETCERIKIPTTHILGSKDPAYRGSLALYNLCDEESAGIYDHGKTHTVPWDLHITQTIAKELGVVISRSNKDH
ncbi:MAG: hypothetical protein Q9218_003607 [Villophora microphyllina]